MKINKRIDFEEVREAVSNLPSKSKIYIGCDSDRFRLKDQWYADYARVIVLHIGGRHGAKIFGEVIRERDYSPSAKSPVMRLFTEAMKVAELYEKLESAIPNSDIEVHLDINPNDNALSHEAMNQAVGYIRGTCNVNPVLKPEAFAATYAADRYKSLSGLAKYRQTF